MNVSKRDLMPLFATLTESMKFFYTFGLRQNEIRWNTTNLLSIVDTGRQVSRWEGERGEKLDDNRIPYLLQQSMCGK
jgi:glutathione peroxidase-family protein